MRHALVAVLVLLLAACGNTPRPFEHDSSSELIYRAKSEKAEVTIETPANMPQQMAERLAAALAIELQSYGIVAGVQPAQAPRKIAGAMSTRDAGSGSGIEIEIEWFLLGPRGAEGPAVSKTNARTQDYAAGDDRLVSRIAQQAAPRIATLLGKPPSFEARSPGQVAAGITVPEAPPPDLQPAPVLKVMVAPVTGAPSDGNQQLFSGMRRALGSNRVVVIDKPGDNTFTVTGSVSLKPIDERLTQLSVKWIVKDPRGTEIGSLDQTNPVPIAATKGSWAGFGDIVASAAVEGVLELLEKALNKGR
jgi:uncharacterized lipoprotein YmbA